MATHKSKTNGRTNGARPLHVDLHLMEEGARRITHSAGGIARIADAVFEGAAAQIRSLDEVVSGVNQMATSLRETASQAESAATSTEQLVSSVNEVSVSIEQVAANAASLATSVTETASAAQETSVHPVGDRDDSGDGVRRAAGRGLRHRDGGLDQVDQPRYRQLCDVGHRDGGRH